MQGAGDTASHGFLSSGAEVYRDESNQINTQIEYLYMSGSNWKETQDDRALREGVGAGSGGGDLSLHLSLTLSASFTLQCFRWWLWGPRSCSRNYKHPGVKQVEKSQSDRFPETWGRRGRDL